MMRFGERVGGRPERSTPRIVGRQRVSAISRVADQVERGQGFVCKRSACVTQSSLHRLVSLAMPESDERGLVRNFLAAGEVEAAGVKGLNQPTSTDQHHDSAICDNSLCDPIERGKKSSAPQARRTPEGTSSHASKYTPNHWYALDDQC
jgi:hypothetical protein